MSIINDNVDYDTDPEDGDVSVDGGNNMFLVLDGRELPIQLLLDKKERQVPSIYDAEIIICGTKKEGYYIVDPYAQSFEHYSVH